MHQRRAEKIVDILADHRLTLHDIDSIAYHVVNLAYRETRKNALVLADAIMYHDANPFHGDDDDTLF